MVLDVSALAIRAWGLASNQSNAVKSGPEFQLREFYPIFVPEPIGYFSTRTMGLPGNRCPKSGDESSCSPFVNALNCIFWGLVILLTPKSFVHICSLVKSPMAWCLNGKCPSISTIFSAWNGPKSSTVATSKLGGSSKASIGSRTAVGSTAPYLGPWLSWGPWGGHSFRPTMTHINYRLYSVLGVLGVHMSPSKSWGEKKMTIP